MNTPKIFKLYCIIIFSSFLLCARLSLSRFRTEIEVIAKEGKADNQVKFVDITQEAGIKFKHAGGLQEQVIPALVGSGVALADYDNDNLLDIYIANASIVFPQPSAKLPTNVLYRNNGDGTFTDVTKQAGVGDAGWGMGCIFGDYDNDGDLDLYVANYKLNVLYQNNGDRTFTDVSAEARVDNKGFGAGAAWADYNNDSYLDIYVANYIDYSILPRGKKIFFPYDFFGQANILYRNNGKGKFTDATTSAGVDGGFYLSLGVAFADYDNDGDSDLYIANDSNPNILFRNNGNGKFTNTNVTEYRSHTGDTRSGMGIAWGDYDNDSDFDLVVNNWQDENSILYRNNGDGTFTDVSAAVGIFAVTVGKTCWGTEFFDYDNDGYLDLFIACGHIDPGPDENPGQSDILLRNNRDGTFTDVSTNTGISALSPKVSRSLACGDYDDDGDIDVFIGNNGDTPYLLRNDGGNKNNWLKIKTVGVKSNKDGIGARITVKSGSLIQIREVSSGSSYISQNSLEVEFGLGERNKVDSIEIRWPSGIIQKLAEVSVNQSINVVESE
ncbi:CRTAC1 family protein [bacterium]|nr:CRTAC1 family protein [bacterium]